MKNVNLNFTISSDSDYTIDESLSFSLTYTYVGNGSSSINRVWHKIVITTKDDDQVEEDKLIILAISSSEIPVFNYNTFNQVIIIIKDNDGTYINELVMSEYIDIGPIYYNFDTVTMSVSENASAVSVCVYISSGKLRQNVIYLSTTDISATSNRHMLISICYIIVYRWFRLHSTAKRTS